MVKNNAAGPPAQELETFLPVDTVNGVTKYKIQPAKKDLENGMVEFNPFAERKIDHPTTDRETLTHLLKASLGTGILSMPIAFKFSGLALGIASTILTALICTHCSYILVKCAHKLYVRTRRTTMGFSDVAESAFANGPKWGRPFARFSRTFILQCLFWTYFGTCSVYTVIIAKNFHQLANYYWPDVVPGPEDDTTLRLCIAALLIPLILLSWVPNLKYLAPFSMVANVFMSISLLITFYYLVANPERPLRPLEERPMVGALWELPGFFAITIFAMEAIGVVMPLENEMKTPQNFVGICGVLNRGMSGVTMVYILLGFLGYWQYGNETAENITLNLPITEYKAQIVKVLVALAVYCTFGLQFYVCLDIGWNSIKEYFVERPTMVNYVMRTVLVTAAVVLAVAVPTIAPFVGLIGAFCFSILGLLVPVIIELVTYWDEGFGPFHWLIWKNIIVTIFGVFALIFGSKDAIEGIVKIYTHTAPAAHAALNETIANITSAVANSTLLN